MAFFIEDPILDIGETAIENIFINNYMRLANETQLKVYIYGNYLAKTRNRTASDIYISKELGIDLEDVEKAWKFWEEKALVKIESGNVIFNSLRELYIQSNYSQKTETKVGVGNEDILRQKSVVEMFKSAESMMNTAISVDERLRYIKMMEKYSYGTEFLLKAIEITYVERPPEKPGRSYVDGILKRWRSLGIDSMKEVIEEEARYMELSEFYRLVNEQLSGRRTKPTKSQVEVIEKWLNEGVEKDFLLTLCAHVSVNYKNPSFGNLDKLANSLKESGKLNEDGLADLKRERSYPKASKSKASPPKQNFSQNTYRTLTEDEEIKIMQRKNPALNIARKVKNE